MSFVDEVLIHDSCQYIDHFGAKFLFSKIPSDCNITIDVCLKDLFLNLGVLVNGMSKINCCSFLSLTTKDSYFTLNNKFWTQIDDVTLGSLLGPILADIFLSHHKENRINNNVL